MKYIAIIMMLMTKTRDNNSYLESSLEFIFIIINFPTPGVYCTALAMQSIINNLLAKYLNRLIGYTDL